MATNAVAVRRRSSVKFKHTNAVSTLGGPKDFPTADAGTIDSRILRLYGIGDTCSNAAKVHSLTSSERF